MSIIDLSLLPAPAIVEELDFETILAQRKARLISLYPSDEQADITATLALDSEPITKLLQENAYLEMVLRQRVNEAAKAVMIALSAGEDLENLVANWKVARLTIQEADTSATPPVDAVMESDEALRLRGLMAWDGLSVAGPTGAYEYFARSASGKVADAKAYSPSPAVAVVTILSTEGDGTADQSLLDTVYAALSGDDVRPIADRLTVQSAAILPYTIAAELTIDSTGAEAEVIVAAATASLQAFINPASRIGVEVPRSAIDAALHVQGVRKVELLDWVDITPSNTQAAYCTGFTIAQASP